MKIPCSANHSSDLLRSWNNILRTGRVPSLAIHRPPSHANLLHLQSCPILGHGDMKKSERWVSTHQLASYELLAS